jgi:hypothetical protein
VTRCDHDVPPQQNIAAFLLAMVLSHPNSAAVGSDIALGHGLMPAVFSVNLVLCCYAFRLAITSTFEFSNDMPEELFFFFQNQF